MTSLSLGSARAITRRRFRGLPARPPRALMRSLGPVVSFLKTVDECVARLNRAAGFQADLEMAIRETSLQRGFPILLTYLDHSLTAASDRLLATWSETTQLLGSHAHLEPTAEWRSLRATRDKLSAEGLPEYLALYNTAVAEVLRDHQVTPKGRELIRELLQKLNLSYDELAQVLRVSGETVRRWEKGATEVPPKQVAALELAEQALRRLLRIFRPARVPSVIRRPAPLFEGATALDWIRSGRIREVADRYETAFAYQG